MSFETRTYRAAEKTKQRGNREPCLTLTQSYPGILILKLNRNEKCEALGLTSERNTLEREKKRERERERKRDISLK